MKIIVIGAGLAGAATAHALAVRGCDVTVLEASGTRDQLSCVPSSSLPSAELSSPHITYISANAALSTAPSAGLPVALLAPHQAQHQSQHAADGEAASPPSPLTQLSRLGVAATLHAARSLLVQGQDWQPCGALQRAGKLGPQARWLGDAAWVKPAALVAAWLAHPRITLRTGAPVHSVRYVLSNSAALAFDEHQKINVDDLSNLKNMGWQAVAADGSLAGQAHAVVLANAYQAKALLAQLELASPEPLEPLTQTNGLPHPKGAALGLSNSNGASGLFNANCTALGAALHQVAGQVIYGPWTADWQALWPSLLPELAQHSLAHTSAANPCAINGNGHFIPAVPWGDGDDTGQHIWLSGSTYEHGAPHNPQVTALGIAANLQRLQQLIPGAATLLAAQHSAGLLQGWVGTRCTTRDRLPVVGAVSADIAPGLYVCSAMGSRGLSFAALCGQEVAAHITAASSALPDHLRRAVDPARFF
jgi:tRNA 5-methylaminomethyl-2-thiouridine biosynthesis bifunctional protein